METEDQFEIEKNISFTKKVYGDKQFQYSNKGDLLPSGFIDYHTKNFETFFKMSSKDFEGKKILDTGCGPGKHAAVLSIMGANVTAVDLTEKNIEKANEMKKKLDLRGLNFSIHNLMNPMETNEDFDLISAHNWMQHSESPAKVMGNLVSVLKQGGRFYLSLYLGGTFRFLIAQIARQILRPKDYETCEKLVGYYFPLGFHDFNNYLDIYMENIFDDFFVPYCNTTSYEILMRDAEKMGCFPIADVPNSVDRYDVDNRYLRVCLEKRTEVDFSDEVFEFTKPIDELSSNNKYVSSISQLVQECIDKFKHSTDPVERSSFCLGLYRVRAELCNIDKIEQKFSRLEFYLKQSIDKNNWMISAKNPIFITKKAKSNQVALFS